jgi:hypothetical protein
MLTPEQIVENYNKFEALAAKTGEHRQAALKEFFSAMGERLAMAPASSKVEFHNCFPGGLVEHSLRVLQNSIKLAKAMDVKVNQEELIFASLFHDIGKLGDLDQERYLEQDDEYWRKRGNLYKVNPKMRFMTVPHNSTFLLQHFGIKVSYDETMAILLNDGHFDPVNEPYKMKEPDLAIVVHQADLISTRWEKTRTGESK